MDFTAGSPGTPGWRWLPAGTTADAVLLLAARGVRAFGDGFISVLLPVYLLGRGLSGAQVGAVATATLLGSAALTLAVGLVAHRFGVRPLLAGAAVLMAATGLCFALVHDFWPLLIVAFVGTLNPSSGDVSVFLPLEQSVLPRTVGSQGRTALFARYSLVGSLIGATGALVAGVPQVVAGRGWLSLDQALQAMFGVYGGLGLVALIAYSRLSTSLDDAHQTHVPLKESRRIVYTLAGLFSLDALGGGFIVQSLLALWLFERFDLSIATAGTI
ncbi:MAG TPA: MFS transporter, partial [Chloroflexota bacterium]